MFPWQWPGDLEDAYHAAFDLMMQIISFSIDFSTLTIVQRLFSEGFGFAIAVAGIVALIMVPGGILFRKLELSGAYAFVIFLFAAAIGAGWFAAVSYATDLGDTLTRGVIYLNGTTFSEFDSAPIFPSFTFGNPMLNGTVFLSMFGFGVALSYLFIAYEVGSILLTVIGVILMLSFGTGPRSRKLFSITIAMLIVMAALGRPTALFIIGFGTSLGRLFPTDDLTWSGIVTFVSVFLAFVSQILLFFGLYKGSSSVVGKINAKVRGFVSTSSRGRSKVDATVKNDIKTTTTNRAKSLESERVKQYRNAEITRAATATAVSAVSALAVRNAAKLAAIGANVHPAAKAAAVVAPHVIRVAGNVRAQKQSTSTRKRDLDGYR